MDYNNVSTDFTEQEISSMDWTVDLGTQSDYVLR